MSTPPQKKKSALKKVAYFNRELSWLAFNRRVLDLAQGTKFRILERLKFLSIVSSNLDEFFEIRVAGLMQQVDSGVIEHGLDGLGPKEQLRRIHGIATALVHDQYACWREQIVPTLKKNGIAFKGKDELTRTEMNWAQEYFEEEIFPVLTPMAIDPSHPFPQLVNKSLNILVSLKSTDKKKRDEKPLMAVIPVPRILPRVVKIETKGANESYIFLSDLIKQFDKQLFPGFKIQGAWAFRITRNSDLYIDEEEAENLLQKIEEELHKMRKGAAVRLEIEEDVDEEMLSELLQAISLPPEYVFRINGPINLMRLMSFYGPLDRADLKDPPFRPNTPAALSKHADIFKSIAATDHLLHHPFESFSPVVEFLKQAASDPKVFAIKQTLYRTSGDSPIIEALKEASNNGKQVTALVELKARFDELNNIQWARELEEVGVHVVYGIVGLKTHCKCCLVVRRETKGLIRYAHLGTGNYNPKTAKIYTDLSFFTARQSITREVADLFNTLTGFSKSPNFKKLLVAPFSLHKKMQFLIKRETQNAKKGLPARITVKVNSLIDQETIDNLYLASQAGVKVELIVRGICGLVPGVRGLSENIRVISVVGRFLEHTRIFCFENGENESEVYLGSADWMPRNFFRRIECIFPVENLKLKKRITDEILPLYLKDTAFSKLLKSNGAYVPFGNHKSDNAFSAQDTLLAEAEAGRKQQEYSRIEEGKSKQKPLTIIKKQQSN